MTEKHGRACWKSAPDSPPQYRLPNSSTQNDSKCFDGVTLRRTRDCQGEKAQQVSLWF